MMILAKVGGELNMHGFRVHWIHKAGDVKDFPEEVGTRILTNKNYEKARAKKPISEEPKSEKYFGKKHKKTSEATKE